MCTNPESQPIRTPRRVDFSAKKRQGGQTELVSSHYDVLRNNFILCQSMLHVVYWRLAHRLKMGVFES